MERSPPRSRPNNYRRRCCIISFLVIISLAFAVGIYYLSGAIAYNQNLTKTWNKTNGTIVDHGADRITCQCYNFLEDCVALNYTGYIVIRYRVNKYEYYDVWDVDCGQTWSEVVELLIKEYPVNSTIPCYYNNEYPNTGVIRYLAYDGNYMWVGTLILWFLSIVFTIGLVRYINK